MKRTILAAIEDLVADFLYYNRKDDDDLPRGMIDQTILDGLITVDEMVQHFRDKLIDGLDFDQYGQNAVPSRK